MAIVPDGCQFLDPGSFWWILAGCWLNFHRVVQGVGAGLIACGAASVVRARRRLAR